MANLKIAPQPANINSPSQPSAKLAHKSASEAHIVDAHDFETKLKQGLAESAKKEEQKKTAKPSIATAQNTTADLAKAAQTAEEEKSEKINSEGEELKKKQSGSDASELLKKLGLSAQTPIKIAATQVKGESAPQEMAKKSGQNETVQKTAVSKADLLKNQAEVEASGVLEKLMSAKTGASSKLDLTQLQAVQGQAQAPDDTSEFDHDFEIQSLAADGVEGKAASDSIGSEQLDAKRAPASKLSTADYLNLRDLAKKDSISAQPQSAIQAAAGLGTKKGKLELLSKDGRLTGGEGLSQNLSTGAINTKAMEATVVPGNAGKAVLSPESLNQVTHTVNLMSQAKQDGEIKIRLRPDHLGELQMSVKTMGNQVSIQIRAQDGEAKRIIEESLGSLKDSFAKQNLNLAQVDVVTSPPATQTQDQGMQMDFANSRQSFGQESRDFSQGQSGRQDRLYEDGFNSSNLNTAAPARNRYASASSQGLDLIA